MWKYSRRVNVNFLSIHSSVCEYSILPGHETDLQFIEYLFSRVSELVCMNELEGYTEGGLDDGMATHARLVLIEVPEKEIFWTSRLAVEREPDIFTWWQLNPFEILITKRPWPKNGLNDHKSRRILDRVTETDYLVRQCKYEKNWILRVNLLHYA